MRIIVQKDETSHLVDNMEKWIPIKERDHRCGQCIDNEHLSRRYHVDADINALCEGDKIGKPRG